MDTKQYRRPFNIQVETISPVSIGNGEILSPYSDFVFDKDAARIHILDKELLTLQTVEKDKTEGTSLMQEYIDGIYDSFDNNRATFNLSSFIEKESKLNTAAESLASYSIPYNGLHPKDRREIKCTTKDGQRPYIPGSTIKGAIKGAMLYDWFYNEEKETFNKLMLQTVATYKKCQREIDGINQIARKDYVNRDDKMEIRRLKREMANKGGRALAKKFNDTINSLLTKNHFLFSKEFAHLRPTDSSLLTEKDLLFQSVYRMHYVKGTVTIPANLEAIQPRKIMNFKLSIQRDFQHLSLQYLNRDQPIENIMDALNKFHKHNVDLELTLLENNPWYDRARPGERTVFLKYRDFLESLYDKMEKVLPNEAYLCLGFGKSFFYNSIGMLVYDWDSSNAGLSEEERSSFMQYCQLFFLGRDGQKNFPLTRTVTNDGKAMGWVKFTWKQ